MFAASMAGRLHCVLCRRCGNVSKRLAVCSLAGHDAWRDSRFPFGLAHKRSDYGHGALLPTSRFTDTHAHPLWASDACAADDLRCGCHDQTEGLGLWQLVEEIGNG